MDNEKHQSAVYSADGVEFTIYQTIKPTKSGPRVYWLLEDYSTGKRRLLNNKTLKAARRRARQNPGRNGQGAGEPDDAE